MYQEIEEKSITKLQRSLYILMKHFLVPSTGSASFLCIQTQGMYQEEENNLLHYKVEDEVVTFK